MSFVLNVPESGQLVDVRQRRFVVVDAAQTFDLALVLAQSFAQRMKQV